MRQFTTLLALPLLLTLSSPTSACFVNGQTCQGSSPLFDLRIPLGESGSFLLQCSDSCQGEVVLGADGQIEVSPSSTSVGAQPQTITVTPGAVGNGSVGLEWFCNDNGQPVSGSCQGSVTTPEAAPDPVEIADIHPMQVVQDPPHEVIREDIPMIVGKRTMVRVFVHLPPGVEEMTNVRAELDWNGQTVGNITAALLKRVNGRTWVIPASKFPDFYNGEGEIADMTAANVSAFIQGRLDRDSKPPGADDGEFFAYNFTFDGGKKMPTSLTLTARIYAEGATEPLATATEESGDTFSIKEFSGSLSPNFTAWVAPYYVGGTPIAKRGRNAGNFSAAELAKLTREKVAQVRNEFLATYPIPEDRITVTGYSKIVVKLLGFTFDNLSEGDSVPSYFNTFTTGITNSFPTTDSMILITGGRSAMSDRGYTPVSRRRVHYVRYDNAGNHLVAAHETGHDDRFAGAGHTNTLDVVQGIRDQITDRVTFAESLVVIFSQVEDGWDAGARFGGRSMRGRFKMMLDGSYGDDYRRWVNVDTYRILLRALVEGGPDPELVAITGLINADGELVTTSINSSVFTGPELPLQTGDGTVQFIDAQGSVIATANVVTSGTSENDPAVQDDGVRLFAVTAVLPEQTASLHFQLPDADPFTLHRSANTPVVSLSDVQSDDVITATVFGRYQATDADDDTLDLRFSYRCGSDKTFMVLTGDQIALNTATGGFTISTTELPGGSDCEIQLEASDGLRLAQTSAASFSVADKPPFVTIGLSYADNGERRLTPLVDDLEDGLELSLQWTSNASNATDPNSPQAGVTYTLTATDSAGNSTQASYTPLAADQAVFETQQSLLRVPSVKVSDQPAAESWVLALNESPTQPASFTLLKRPIAAVQTPSIDSRFDVNSGILELPAVMIPPSLSVAAGELYSLTLRERAGSEPKVFDIECPSDFGAEVLLTDPCVASVAPSAPEITGARVAADNFTLLLNPVADAASISVTARCSGASQVLEASEAQYALSFAHPTLGRDNAFECTATNTNAAGTSAASRPFYVTLGDDPRLSDLGQIQLVYIGLLGRGADYPGTAYWLNEVRSEGLTLKRFLSIVVSAQPEYADGLGKLERGALVTALYGNLFGRAPDGPGFEYWVNGGGQSTPEDELSLALINGAQGDDIQALINKTKAALYYANRYSSFDSQQAEQAVQDVDHTNESLVAAMAYIDSVSN